MYICLPQITNLEVKQVNIQTQSPQVQPQFLSMTVKKPADHSHTYRAIEQNYAKRKQQKKRIPILVIVYI